MTIDKIVEIKQEISEQIKQNAQHRRLLIELGAGNEIIIPLIIVANGLEEALEQVEKIIREAP